MRLADLFLSELEREAPATRRMLERVPEARFAWKPHEKSMPLGRLATHVAELPAMGVRICTAEEHVIAPGAYRPRVAANLAEVLETFDANVRSLAAALPALSDEQMAAPWRMRRGDAVVRELPRGAALRAVCFSHIVHHRGQLSVYLRLLDVPLPGVYGPTADEAR
ncbi:MAG TPA: DinB family protein [Thermoanaerobaculaceae bacterium]|nr:DinB family protein [Thermoanaerobaculaceae bacterium]